MVIETVSPGHGWFFLDGFSWESDQRGPGYF